MGRTKELVCERKAFLINRSTRYVLVGIWNACISLSFFYILLKLLGHTHYQMVLAISFILSTIHSHLTQRSIVWKSSAPYIGELFKFANGTIGQYIINALLLQLMVGYLQFSAAFSQPAIAILVALISFVYFKSHVFKESNR